MIGILTFKQNFEVLGYFLRFYAINLLNSLIFFIFQSRIELLSRKTMIVINNYNKLRYQTGSI